MDTFFSLVKSFLKRSGVLIAVFFVSVIVSSLFPIFGIVLGAAFLIIPLISLFKPLNYLWLGSKIFSVCLILFVGLPITAVSVATIFIERTALKEEAQLAQLRETDAAAYLAELKGHNKGLWLEELAALDPEQHKIEVERIAEERAREQAEKQAQDQERAKQEEEKRKQEAERLAKRAEEAAAALWSYSHRDDPMSKGVTHTARILSSNRVNFDFPYSGAQHGRLTLRTHPKHGKDVIFSIDRGQILCPPYDSCTIRVRFDDESAISYTAVGSADNSTETIFIRNYSAFVGRMMKAKRVRISMNIYQEGSPVFDFDVSGFNVEKYKPKT